MANNWNTILQSTDIHRYNSRNSYVEIHLKTSKHVTDGGQIKLKVECWTKLFKIINHQRIYNDEEELTSNIYNIPIGNTLSKDLFYKLSFFIAMLSFSPS